MAALPSEKKPVIRTRVAPSPTGDPHIGTIYMSLFDFALARKNAGQFIVRSEDTDRSRLIEGSEQTILDAIKWFGLAYDEGPDVGGSYEPYRQSERLEIYTKYALELVAKKAAYYCFCTGERLAALRVSQQEKKEPPRYDRLCLTLSPDMVAKRLQSEKHVIRLHIPEGETTFHDEIRGDITFQNSTIDDQVLLKSDGFPTYHLAVVVDDQLMKITHIIRGEEWISSTPKHIILYRAFGWDLPQFVHLSLLRNADKSKLSKRKNNTSVTWYREQGYLPEAVLNFLGLMGYTFPGGRELFSLEEFIAQFSFDRVNITGPIFDFVKLDWMNGEYIRKLPVEELSERLISFDPGIRNLDSGILHQVLLLVQERLKRLGEFRMLTSFFFEDGIELDVSLLIQTVKKTKEEIHQALTLLATNLEQADFGNHDELEQITRTTAGEGGFRAPELFMATRIAITGQKATPPLFDTMKVIGKEKVLERLMTAARTIRMNVTD